ncbi:MAG: hypothetical protein CSA22_00095 [Deltaproteobacteria bacterium]|nr:MAG: hypothetical protein CSA22_00095 [Deltaproteobacteria bacterium]
MMGKTIGLIAGNGQFPVLFARKAQTAGMRVVAAGFRNETSKALEDAVSQMKWLHLGQVSRLLNYFRSEGVTEAVMVGGIRKTRMFTDVKPDLKALGLLRTLKTTHDDGILKAFAVLLEKEGIRIQASTGILPELLAPHGCWTRAYPNAAQQSDISFGWEIAKTIGKLDIGQCIVVSGGSVLAVEAIEGTDAAIARGAGFSDGDAVVIKICKPQQDRRFDIPAIGMETLKTMQQHGARVLVIEAGQAVVFDRAAMIDFADEQGIRIVALSPDGVLPDRQGQ